jgi:hypothetical protein
LSSMPNDTSNVNDTTDYSPLLLKSIVKEVDAAITHLNNYVA